MSIYTSLTVTSDKDFSGTESKGVSIPRRDTSTHTTPLMGLDTRKIAHAQIESENIRRLFAEIRHAK